MASIISRPLACRLFDDILGMGTPLVGDFDFFENGARRPTTTILDESADAPPFSSHYHALPEYDALMTFWCRLSAPPLFLGQRLSADCLCLAYWHCHTLFCHLFPKCAHLSRILTWFSISARHATGHAIRFHIFGLVCVTLFVWFYLFPLAAEQNDFDIQMRLMRFSPLHRKSELKGYRTIFCWHILQTATCRRISFRKEQILRVSVTSALLRPF